MLCDPSPANEDILPQASKGSYFFNRIGQELPFDTSIRPSTSRPEQPSDDNGYFW